jgi:hypothetical protein
MIERSQLPTLNYDFRATGLVVFDMLEAYRPQIEAAGSIGPTRELIDACRGVGIPIFYARADHRGDGADFARTIADTDRHFRPWGPDNPYRGSPAYASGSPEMSVLAEIAPLPGDAACEALVGVPRHISSCLCGRHRRHLLVGGSVRRRRGDRHDARDKSFQSPSCRSAAWPGAARLLHGRCRGCATCVRSVT